MNKVIICYGTRPELIKLAPLVWEIRKRNLEEHLIIVSTNQHRHTMDEESFAIVPDYNLNVFSEGQSLAQLSSKITARLDLLIQQLNANQSLISAIIAQGDTLSTLCSAQTSFFNKIPFFHIESGLRSETIHSPFPEEFNRRTISSITNFHYAPSTNERNNLINEGIPGNKILVVGNTVNDILFHFFNKGTEHKCTKDTVLFSIHRRANQNGKLHLISSQLAELAEEHKQFKFIWLTHPTKRIKEAAYKIASEQATIKIKMNASYQEMIAYYKKCRVVITDSGGIMEESAALGIPRIILRNDNERIGLLAADDTFLNDPIDKNLNETFKKTIASTGTPNYIYGKGNASELILNSLIEQLQWV